jgi:hypothetical protein
MKNSAALLALAALTVVLAACGSSSDGATATAGNTVTGPHGEMLLVNPNSDQDNSEMEAAFDGSLVLGSGNCIIGKSVDGQETALVFPADTKFAKGEPLTVELEGHSIEVGVPMSVTLGGGVLSGGQLSKLLEKAPEQCRQKETFYVQTVSTPLP